jgi:hypothetical protein
MSPGIISEARAIGKNEKTPRSTGTQDSHIAGAETAFIDGQVLESTVLRISAEGFRSTHAF